MDTVFYDDNSALLKVCRGGKDGNILDKYKMSKVLVVATSRKTRGGITSVVKAHEEGTQWKDFNCHWIETHRDGSSVRKLWYLMRGMADYLLCLPSADLVHLHISQPTTIRRKLVFLEMATRLKKKVIVHFHAFNVEDTIGGGYSKRYRDFFGHADKIVVLSNWWKTQLIQELGIEPERIEVLYNPCPKVMVIKESGLKKPVILYAGTVNQRKGYADLIKAFAEISKDNPKWELWIAGNGEIDEGKALSEELGVEEKVKFLGWVSGYDKDRAFRQASVFCLPSYAEGFPMAVLDAWAYGLPVVTTPVGGIPDVAKDGENMLLFEPGDVATLAKQLNRLMNDEVLYEKVKQASKSFAEHEFNQNEINEKLGRIYASVLAGK